MNLFPHNWDKNCVMSIHEGMLWDYKVLKGNVTKSLEIYLESLEKALNWHSLKYFQFTFDFILIESSSSWWRAKYLFFPLSRKDYFFNFLLFLSFPLSFSFYISPPVSNLIMWKGKRRRKRRKLKKINKQISWSEHEHSPLKWGMMIMSNRLERVYKQFWSFLPLLRKRDTIEEWSEVWAKK